MSARSRRFPWFSSAKPLQPRLDVRAFAPTVDTRWCCPICSVRWLPLFELGSHMAACDGTDPFLSLPLADLAASVTGCYCNVFDCKHKGPGDGRSLLEGLVPYQDAVRRKLS